MRCSSLRNLIARGEGSQVHDSEVHALLVAASAGEPARGGSAARVRTDRTAVTRNATDPCSTRSWTSASTRYARPSDMVAPLTENIVTIELILNILCHISRDDARRTAAVHVPVHVPVPGMLYLSRSHKRQ